MAVGKFIAVVAGIGAVGAGVAGVAGQDHTTRNDEGEITEGGEIGAFRIRIGDCIVGTLDGEFESADAVPCTSPHESEVYAAFMMSYPADAAYPGEAAVVDAASDGCFDRFEPFVGQPYESSIFDFGAMYPSEGSWDGLDDREVLCLISNYDGTLKTGTAHNAGR